MHAIGVAAFVLLLFLEDAIEQARRVVGYHLVKTVPDLRSATVKVVYQCSTRVHVEFSVVMR